MAFTTDTPYVYKNLKFWNLTFCSALCFVVWFSLRLFLLLYGTKKNFNKSYVHLRTSSIAFHLFIEIKNRTSIRKSYDIFYHGICWGLPILSVAALVSAGVVEPINSEKWCHLEGIFEFIFWFVPIVTCLIWNLIFYFLIIREVMILIPNSQAQNRQKVIYQFVKRLG